MQFDPSSGPGRGCGALASEATRLPARWRSRPPHGRTRDAPPDCGPASRGDCHPRQVVGGSRGAPARRCRKTRRPLKRSRQTARYSSGVMQASNRALSSSGRSQSLALRSTVELLYMIGEGVSTPSHPHQRNPLPRAVPRFGVGHGRTVIWMPVVPAERAEGRPLGFTRFVEARGRLARHGSHRGPCHSLRGHGSPVEA